MPSSVLPVIRRCLQKDPARRLHHIADARIEIGDSVFEPSQAIRVAQRFPRRWISISTAALLFGLLGGALLMRYFRPSAASSVSQSVIRIQMRLESGQWLDGMRWPPPYGFDLPTRTAVAISGDGRFLVYSAVKENPGTQDRPRLYLRRLDRLEAKPIEGTEGGISPFLSPDDRWVGFWADRKLKKASVDGGVATELCDVASPFGFTWADDNHIVFASAGSAGLLTISAEGGKPETLTVCDKSKEEYSHRLPHCIHNGKGILFTITRHGADWQPRVAVLDPATRKWRVLLEDAADARYMTTGHLAFLRQGKLMLASFDAARLEITGQPFPVIDNITQALNTGSSNSDTAAGQFSVSA